MIFAKPWFRQSSRDTFDYIGPIPLYESKLNALLYFGSFEFFPGSELGNQFKVFANSTERAIAILKEIKFLTQGWLLTNPRVEVTSISGQLDKKLTDEGNYSI